MRTYSPGVVACCRRFVVQSLGFRVKTRTSRSSMIRHGIPLAFVFAALAFAGSLSAEPRRVLLLHSFGFDFAPFDAFAAEFRTDLAADFPDSIEFFQISLESARFGAEQADDALVTYLTTLFAGRGVDLIVTIGGPAAGFVQDRREALFPDIPLLMAAVDRRHLKAHSYGGNNVVVAVENIPTKTIDTILEVLPNTESIAVVMGSSPLETFWLGELRNDFRVFEDRVDFVWLDGLSFRDLEQRCANLPPRSAIFFAIFYIDALGVPYSKYHVLSRLADTANAPIFGLHSTQLGNGIVGGALMDIEGLADHSALVARRLLNGENPDQIKNAVISQAAPRFDWPRMSQWKISEASLPPGSIVERRQPTFWERYRGRVMITSVVVVAQFALIGMLLINRSKRRRAEHFLRESERRLSLATEAADVGVWVWDTASNRIWATDEWRAIFGFVGVADIDAGDVWERVHSGDRKEVDEKIESAKNGRSRFTAEFRLVRPDGSTRWVSTRGRMIESKDGHDVRMLGASIDVTKRRESEQASRDFSRRLITAQEEDRARLGRELHDDISQRLARLAIDVGTIQRQGVDGRLGERLEDLRAGLAGLSEDVHSLAYQVHPAVLVDLGLVQALRSECERFSRQESIPAHVHVEGVSGRLPWEASLCLFRVAQEALRNVARHARARSVEISLWAKDDGLKLAVSDTGVGFDPTDARRGPSLGLRGMRERVLILKGELDIEAIPGHGTKIIAWIPLEQNPA